MFLCAKIRIAALILLTLLGIHRIQHYSFNILDHILALFATTPKAILFLIPLQKILSNDAIE
jgi:hypothetical protein